MTSAIEQKLSALGIILPVPAAPVAAYVPYVITGSLAFFSGQLPMENGVVKTTGRLGDDVDLVAGAAAARLCGINLLAQLKQACGGDLGRVARCVRLGGLVASTPEFADHSKVVNGASELMLEVFGESGRHARTSIGVASLPLNAAVEVEGLFELRD